MAAGERGTQRQNREDGKRPRPISQAAFQVDELRQFGVADIRHLPRLTLDHPALTVRVDRKIFEDADHTIQGAFWLFRLFGQSEFKLPVRSTPRCLTETLIITAVAPAEDRLRGRWLAPAFKVMQFKLDGGSAIPETIEEAAAWES
jgi:hypothetical protein